MIITNLSILSTEIWTAMRKASMRFFPTKKPLHLSKGSNSSPRSLLSLCSQNKERYRKMSFSTNTSRYSKMMRMKMKRVREVLMGSMRMILRTTRSMPNLSNRVRQNGKRLSLGALSYQRTHSSTIFVNQRLV